MSIDSQIYNILSEAIDIKNYQGNKMLYNLDESEKINITDKMVAALYKSAMNKYNGIDFEFIPDAKGDITKLKNYNTLIQSIDTLKNIQSQFKVKLNELQIIEESIRILQAYKKEFCLCFIQDKQFGQAIFNTVTMGIIYGVDMCINATVSFITTPNSDLKNSMSIQRKYKSESNILFDNLQKINDAANSGKLKDLFDKLLNKNNLLGGVTASTVIGIAALSLIGVAVLVIAIRELIYFFFNTRLRLSDYFKKQAKFLELNITELKSVNAPQTIANKDEVIKKQQKKVDQLLKLADKFEMEFVKQQRDAEKELSKKITPDEAINNDIDNISLI